MGLVNRILPPGEVLDHARRQCERLCRLPPDAVRETKRLMKAGWRAALDKAIGSENAVLQQLIHGPYAREAFAAFAQGRKPDFSQLGPA